MHSQAEPGNERKGALWAAFSKLLHYAAGVEFVDLLVY